MIASEHAGSDTAYAAGGAIFTSSNTAISNVIARSERYWNFASVTTTSGESITVLFTCMYNITVYVAEIYYSTAGKRKMNYQINSQNLFNSSIDMARTYGFGSLQAFSKLIYVTTGKIDIVAS